MLFCFWVFRIFLQRGVRVDRVVEQIYFAGVRALPTTLLAGGFVGAIMAIQVHLQLKDFGAESFLGGISTSTTLRNIGPMLIAFILCGKVGTQACAELGTMRVTDQIDALRCLGVHPVEFLIIPKLIAATLSSFLLLVIGLFFTVVGGCLISSGLGVNTLQYLGNIPSVITASSVAVALTKSLIFGLLIGIIGCYRGYTTARGAAGVGLSVRKTSVETLIAIIFANFVVSFMVGGM